MKPLVFLAVDPARVPALRDQGTVPQGLAFAATPELTEHFDYGEGSEEDADYAAQVFASLAGLAAGWDRCVLAIAVPRLPNSAGEVSHGEVGQPAFGWTDVQAIFVDEPAALPLTRAYAEQARGRDIADLWADPATDALLAEHDLLWYAPSELDQALAGHSTHPTSKGN